MINFQSLKKLVIAPHIDDEVLGLGALLDVNTHVLHLGCSPQQNHGNILLSRNDRLLEWESVSQLTGCSHTLLDHPVNNYQVSNLIPDIEKFINFTKSDICFIPNASYNQDHKASYEASIIALRPHDLNFFVPNVFIYYQPQDLWMPNIPAEPNTFFHVCIKEHLRTYLCLSSQVRSYRSPEIIKSQLSVYGAMAGFDYALAFRCIRNVISL